MNLDPRGFTQGQARAAEQLRNLERETQRSTQNIGGRVAGSIRNFFTGFADHFKRTNQQMETLGTQSRRTGFSISSGAAAGAAGLTTMTTAALAAYTALKSVQGVLGSIKDASARGAETGRAAPELGLGPQWLDAFTKAANVASNANPAQTRENLQSLQEDLNRFRLGLGMSERLKQMAIGGVNVSQSDTIQSLLDKVSTNLAGLSPSDARTRANTYGINPDLGRFLRQGPEAVHRQTEHEMPVSVTQAQTEAFIRLQSAVNSVQQAWDGLVNKFIERNPQISKAIETFDALLRDLQSTPEGMKKVEVAFEAVAAAIALALGTIVARFIWANTAIARTPLGKAFIAAWAAGELLTGPGISVLPSHRTPEEESEYQRQKGDETDRIGRETPPWRQIWNWITGKKESDVVASAEIPRSTVGQPTTGTGEGHVATKAERLAYARQYAVSKGLNPDAIEATMRGEGLARYSGDNNTSFGDFQLHTDPRSPSMGDAALAAGVDIRDAKTWQAQHRFAIDQMVANKDKSNAAAWYAGQWHGAPAWAAQSFANPAAAPRKLFSQSTYDNKEMSPGDKWLNENAPFPTLGNNGQTPPIRWRSDTPAIDKPNPGDYGPGSPFGAAAPAIIPPAPHLARALHAIRAGNHVVNGDTTNNHSTAIGDVHVHTPATDVDGISRDIRGALQGEMRKNVLVNQANTGLD